ncbi:MAG: hypothetical protein WD055_06300 [Candidatus Dependentiae bacterium]
MENAIIASMMRYACLSLLISYSVSIFADQPELLEQLNDLKEYRTGYYKNPENDPKNQNQQQRKRFIDKQDELPIKK